MPRQEAWRRQGLTTACSGQGDRGGRRWSASNDHGRATAMYGIKTALKKLKKRFFIERKWS